MTSGRDLFVLCNLQASLHEGVEGQEQSELGKKSREGL